MSKTGFTLIIFIIALVLSGCRRRTDAEHKAVRAAAQEYMEMLKDGEIDDYVAGIVYADSMTGDYMSQMADLLAEHVAMLQAEHGGIKEVRAVADTLLDQHAQVFLEVMFADSTIESIDLPMVKDGKTWKMQ
ncbi:MAG: DUF4878 domain-containing protein [Bacteroidaceae bacterium]|nr:DUF4878 domain-containing protein [Bacteroidaceae bacterium]